MKKLLLLLLAATFSFGFTACSDDDYPTLARRNADKIRSLGIDHAFVCFNNLYENSYDDDYDVAIEGDFLVLTKKNENWSYKIYVPLDNIKEIMNTSGFYTIYLL